MDHVVGNPYWCARDPRLEYRVRQYYGRCNCVLQRSIIIFIVDLVNASMTQHYGSRLEWARLAAPTLDSVSLPYSHWREPHLCWKCLRNKPWETSASTMRCKCANIHHHGSLRPVHQQQIPLPCPSALQRLSALWSRQQAMLHSVCQVRM